MKERIEKRIKELKEAREQFIANINACDGAISELEQLLIEPKEIKTN
jgi:prefoldin subunit 5